MDERLDPFAANVLRTVVFETNPWSRVTRYEFSKAPETRELSAVEPITDRRPDEVVVMGHDPQALAFLHL